MQPSNQNPTHMYQKYVDAQNQGTYNQIPAEEVHRNYGQFVRSAPPQVVEQAHHQFYSQMPQQQRGDLLGSLVGALTGQGYDPREAGVSTTDPYRMSPEDAARVTGYAQQRDPDILDRIMGPGGPLGSTGAKLAAAGLLAAAAKHFLGGQGGFDLGSLGNSLAGLGSGNNTGNPGITNPPNNQRGGLL